MTFQLLTPGSYAIAVAARYGGLDPLSGPEALAEVVRYELFALGHALRCVLVQRVQKLLALFPVSLADVEEVVRTLEAVGDVSAGPYGEVACAPLRGVSTGAGRWLLVGTRPSGELRARLGVAMTGLPRRLSTPEDKAVAGGVTDLGGHLLSVERWAGLDRHPPVSRWLGELRERLEAADRFADRAGALRWMDLEIYRPRSGDATYRALAKNEVPVDTPVLVRARQAGGWIAYAWAQRQGETLALVPLTGDEARRTRFAVDAEAGASLVFDAAPCEGGVDLALPVLLPAAEYRYLSAVGEMKESPRRVRLDERAVGAATALLRERLGLVVETPGATMGQSPATLSSAPNPGRTR